MQYIMSGREFTFPPSSSSSSSHLGLGLPFFILVRCQSLKGTRANVSWLLFFMFSLFLLFFWFVLLLFFFFSLLKFFVFVFIVAVFVFLLVPVNVLAISSIYIVVFLLLL
ncbi:hypothetical protein IHE45_04G099400 [Dioscorea alata]|uniref:Uncharacterized protein n=1 Tax=Dioscorea alata TaxID=55571 RepID=A0ACB7WEU4_DIOAL|nr:hypothetical protein IHE45_04G099400 [Dioscorea alata]